MIGLSAAAVVVVALVANAVVVSRHTVAAAFEDGDLHVVEDGPPGAPVLVLLHGFAASVAWWEPVVPALARDFRVIRIDRLGHGRSAKPATGYDIPSQVQAVVAVLSRRGIDRAVVVGHSSGGVVAAALAQQRPGLVAGTVLIGTGPTLESFTAGGLLSRLLTVPVAGQLLWRLRTGNLIRKALATAFTREVAIPDQLIADVRATTYRSFTAAADEVTSFLAQGGLPDRLATVDVPLLVIFGTQDKRWDPAAVAGYRAVRNVQIEMLDGIGHTPMFEATERTIALLTHYVTRQVA